MATKPKTQSERERCIEALARLFVPSCEHHVSPLVRAELASKYLPALALYNTARERYHAKKSSEVAAQEGLDRARSLHDKTFRAWRNSVKNESGQILSIDLRKVLGVSPSELLRLPNRERLRATEALRVCLRDLPHLAGDPEMLARLLEARDRLAERVAHFDHAEQDRIAAKERYDQATALLDQRVQSAAVLLLQVHPALAQAILPEMRRKPKKPKNSETIEPPKSGESQAA